uniref:Putative secreted peptide n=1 Tax=Anopheles braziliensis TaxID=58242 RepID=A0A2M3ZWY7_9DIPT
MSAIYSGLFLCAFGLTTGREGSECIAPMRDRCDWVWPNCGDPAPHPPPNILTGSTNTQCLSGPETAIIFVPSHKTNDKT